MNEQVKENIDGGHTYVPATRHLKKVDRATTGFKAKKYRDVSSNRVIITIGTD